ncbi:hypothetical protein BT69DRAFT_1010762 [Atractiella rhizophila]|nr:hypothetical protein BT69DRAFT_1010762 [Atractiella rhizophila]
MSSTPPRAHSTVTPKRGAIVAQLPTPTSTVRSPAVTKVPPITLRPVMAIQSPYLQSIIPQPFIPQPHLSAPPHIQLSVPNLPRHKQMSIRFPGRLYRVYLSEMPLKDARLLRESLIIEMSNMWASDVDRSVIADKFHELSEVHVSKSTFSMQQLFQFYIQFCFQIRLQPYPIIHLKVLYFLDSQITDYKEMVRFLKLLENINAQHRAVGLLRSFVVDEMELWKVRALGEKMMEVMTQDKRRLRKPKVKSYAEVSSTFVWEFRRYVAESALRKALIVEDWEIWMGRKENSPRRRKRRKSVIGVLPDPTAQILNNPQHGAPAMPPYPELVYSSATTVMASVKRLVDAWIESKPAMSTLKKWDMDKGNNDIHLFLDKYK